MALLLMVLLCMAMVVLPLGGLVLQSASASAYWQAWQRASDSLIRSLLFAAIGATALSVLGFLVGYLIQTRATRAWRAVDALTVLLFALPSTVIGMGLIASWNHPLTNIVYATPLIIILGYIAQYTALTSRITATTLATIPPSMEEAAQIAGAGWLRRVIHIVAPLSARGIVAGWLVAYIFCLRDTGITMMVYPPGSDTLPVRIFTLMANGSASLVAASCVMMILATLAPVAALAFVGKRSRGIRYT
jgi:iron(III) transport system permease protein